MLKVKVKEGSEIIFIGGIRLKILVKEAYGYERFLGLMFRTKNTENLLIRFDKLTRTPIHSIFVFFPFVALWIDENNSIMEMREVQPFEKNIVPEKEFFKLIEIPINEINTKILNQLNLNRLET